MPENTPDTPTIMSPGGELVHVVQAADLLRAGGLEDLGEATLEQLARWTDNAGQLASVTQEAKALVSAELVRRLDKRLKWTVKEDGFEIKSSSPDAGTTVYDTDLLAAAIAALIDAEKIDRDGADNALEWVTPEAPKPHWKQKPAGINALRKLGPDVAAAIDACKLEVAPPQRTAKVKRLQAPR